MFNPSALKIIPKEKTEIVLPRYQDYCFANLPSTILKLFGCQHSRSVLPQNTLPYVQKYQYVILILIDAFGFQSLKNQQGQFRFLTKNAIVSPLTTIFPSTTAAALSTLQTGVLPKKHGLLEWHLYLPEVGQVIETLPFSLPSSSQDELLVKGFSPKLLLDQKTIFQILSQERGVHSFTFIKREYAHSAYSKISQKGAKNIAYQGLTDLFVNLKNAFQYQTKKSSPTYFYAYIDSLDSLGHQYGPQSEAYQEEVKRIAWSLKNIFLANLSPQERKKALLIITADHGQIAIDPQQNFSLNRFLKLKKNLKTNPAGEKILATGGRRDIFLHVKKEEAPSTLLYLQKKLSETAWVYSLKKAQEIGLFGPGKASKRFQQRAGDILILPRGKAIFWLEKQRRKKPPKLGHHGGLSPEEMLIPLIVADLSHLS
ncbi:alkaline phosphatase family protein [Candidatus Shapirobacteria bacterium]|nr:alkaline phosphatase family protein [Candidatus Shapirobacteria bacterium]